MGTSKDVVLQIINKEVLKNDENSNGPSFTLKSRSERFPLNNLDHGDLVDLEQPANIMIRIYVTYGYPSDKILEFSNKHQVNLIVIGSIGLTGFSRIKALGSVARSISERAKGPVMIVR